MPLPPAAGPRRGEKGIRGGGQGPRSDQVLSPTAKTDAFPQKQVHVMPPKASVLSPLAGGGEWVTGTQPLHPWPHRVPARLGLSHPEEWAPLANCRMHFFELVPPHPTPKRHLFLNAQRDTAGQWWPCLAVHLINTGSSQDHCLPPCPNSPLNPY